MKTYDASNFKDVPAPQPSNWIVEGIFKTHQKRPSLLVGLAEGGKSTLATQLAVNVMQGEPFLGRATQKSKVIYWKYEDSAEDTKDDFRKAGWREGIDQLVLLIPDAGDDNLQCLADTLAANPDTKLVILETILDFLAIRDSNSTEAVKAELKKFNAHDILGRDQEDLDDLAAAVRKDPAMRKAVATFSRFGGTQTIDEILAGMNKVDPQSAGTLMQYLGLSPKDLGDMQNKRLQEQTEAKAKPTAAEKIDSDAKANAVLADPKESADRKAQATAFLKGSTSTAAGKAAAEATAKTKAETNSGDVQQAARNIVSGDLTNLKDITSMRGGQRTAMFNAIHDEAVQQGKNPNDWSPAALKTKADMWEDYRQGKTSNNIAAFDAFLGHANDAMDANDTWRRAGSPLINKPLTWLAKNAENDTNYTAFTTALEPVRKEFMSFLNANRAEHEGDLKTMGAVLSDASSPAQIETALKQLGKSADIRLAAIGRKYQNTMGTAFPNLISDEGKQTLQRMGITSKTGSTGAASNLPQQE